MVPELEHGQVAFALGGGLEAAAVEGQPEQVEAVEAFAVEDALEVELEKGLAHEAGIVAQQAEAAAVGDEAPGVAAGGVEEVLEQDGGAAAGAAKTRVGGVEIEVGGHEHERHAVGQVRDRKVALLEGLGRAGG